MIVKNPGAISLEFFDFYRFAATVLLNRSWWTRRYFTSFLSLADLSTYAKSKNQISFSNLANAFMRLNLRVARVNFVKKDFQCKYCFIFDTDRLLDFIKLSKHPSAEPTCVYNFWCFWCSDFQRAVIVTIRFTLQTSIIYELSSYQTFLPYALHSEVWSCVWMGNSSKFNFLQQWDLDLCDSRDLPSFPSLYPKTCQEYCISCSFCKEFTLYSNWKNVWKLTVIQTSTVPHNSVQVSRAPKRLFCDLCFFGWQNDYAWTLPSIKTLNSPIIFLSASPVFSKLPDIKLQKSTELNIDRKESFS